jgi:CHASE2 domain-containing sensor protein
MLRYLLLILLLPILFWLWNWFVRGITKVVLYIPYIKKKWDVLPNKRLIRKFILNTIFGLSIVLLLIFFKDLPWLMDEEDASMDLIMQFNQKIIPSIEKKNIPAFVFLDIDDNTYHAWGEPLFTPRDRLKNLIDAAVKSKARLILVDVDLSQATPVEKSQLHPNDQELKTYLSEYVTKCKTSQSDCPTIIFIRNFSVKSSTIPVIRADFLEEVINEKSAPYLQWASAHFYQSEDKVIRRWSLWETACNNVQQPVVIPAIELLAMGVIKNCTTEIEQVLQTFQPNNCSEQNTSKKPSDIQFCGMNISTNIRGVNQRIMYSMPWLVEDEAPSLPYILYDEKDKPIVTIFSAQAYAESKSQASLEALKDNIVIIGGSYRDGGDIHLTPLDTMPGSLIIINAIHTLLEYNSIQSLSIIYQLIFMILCIFIISYIRIKLNYIWNLVIVSIIIMVVIPLSIILFSHGIWLNLALPLVAVQLNEMLSEHLKIN